MENVCFGENLFVSRMFLVFLHGEGETGLLFALSISRVVLFDLTGAAFAALAESVEHSKLRAINPAKNLFSDAKLAVFANKETVKIVKHLLDPSQHVTKLRSHVSRLVSSQSTMQQ